MSYSNEDDMTTKTKTIEVNIEHPLEDFFEIDSCSTVVHQEKRLTEADNPTTAGYDDKDQQIDEQFQEIYNLALDAYNSQADEVDVVDSKFKARTQEVAVQLLNTALAAANSRGTLKHQKEKISVAAAKIKGGAVTNNNTIVGTTKEILKMLRDAKSGDVVSDQ